MPRSSMILKQLDNGDWVDDNGGNWSAESTANTGAPTPFWNLNHHVVARVDVDTLAVSHIERLMSTPTGAASPRAAACSFKSAFRQRKTMGGGGHR